MPISAGFLIEVGGAALPEDIAAMMVSAVVDDSLRLPDLFILRFRDPQRLVIAKAKFKVGVQLKVSVITADGKSPQSLISGDVTAMEVEFDPTGTFTVIRGYDRAHLLFRGRRTQTYTQSTASDVVKQVAQRAGLKAGTIESSSTVFDHLSQGGITDWEFLEGLAREVGFEISVKDGSLDFRPPVKASGAPSGSDSDDNPLILVPGTDLIRFRAVVTSAEQVKEVQVRGWDVAQKLALIATEAAQTDTVILPTVRPSDMAAAFGDPVYVATDVPYRSQAEVAAAAKALAQELAGAFAQFEGVARGNPKLRANAAISVDGVGEPFDGQYTITTSRHRYEATTGYTTSFAVTGRQERSLYGLTSGGGGRKTALGPVVGLVSDSNDPEKLGRVKVTFPWLSDDYVSDWARTVFPGAGKNRGFTNVPEVGDEVLVLFEQGDISRPYVLGGLFNGIDQPASRSASEIDAGSGGVNRRSWVSRNAHRIDLMDEDGRSEGISLTCNGETLHLTMDAVDTKITIHSDGKVLVEGKGGVMIDSGTAKLELKGGEVSINATTGVKINGGSGAVDVITNGQLTLKGVTAKLEASSQVEVKGGAVAVLGAPLVKIN